LSYQLIPITIRLVSPHLKVVEKALYGFLKGNTMSGELVSLKVVLEIAWYEAMPIYHVSPT